MSGQTNNTTILAADNQLIITQNEQTTELNDIEEAILSLKAVIASTGGGGGSGGGGGDGPTGIQDMIGIDPLEDFTPEQGNNRCGVANFIFDGIYQCADELGDGPLQGLTTLTAAITTGIPAGVLVATVFASSPVILAVAGGVLIGAIAAYLAYNADFADIASELAEQKQAIINDLYLAKDLYEAKAAFTDNCSGLSTPNQLLLGLLCHADILKVLFISNFAVPAGYTPTEPCENLDQGLGDWITINAGEIEIPDTSTRYYDYFEVEASIGTVFGGGGWVDRYYLLAQNNDPDSTTTRRFTIDCLDSTYTISGIAATDPLFYSQKPFIGGNTIIPTEIEAGVYDVTGCNFVRLDTIQGSAGLKIKIEVAP